MAAQGTATPLEIERAPAGVPAALVGNAALAAAWLACHATTLRWIARSFAEPSLRLNLGLLIALVGLGTWRLASTIDARALHEALARAPRLRAIPLALTLLSLGGWLACERFLDVDLVAATCLGVGGYGLVGLYVSPARWRRGMPIALLGIALLPFARQADGYLGFGARVVTADVVARVLGAFGVTALPSGSVLLLDTGVASVDAPCSGLRSLWTGALCFLVASWLERRAPGRRWLVVAIGYAVALLVANVARVAALVLVSIVLGAPRLGEAIHAPLGVLGFALASALALLALRRWVPIARDGGGALPSRKAHPGVAFALAASCAIAGLAHARRPVAGDGTAAFHLTLPDELRPQPLALSDAEEDLFHRWGRASAAKWRVSWRGREASVLAVYSETWRAHHPPELCLVGGGHTLGAIDRVAAGTTREWRRLTVDCDAAALTWYQSDARTVGDLATRVGGGLWGGERRWVEVTILVAAGASPEDEQALYDTIRARIGRALDDSKEVGR